MSGWALLPVGWATSGREIELEGDMSGTDESFQVVGPGEVARRLKLEYSRGVKDQTQKVLEEIIELCVQVERPEIPIRTICTRAGELITKRLGIANVAIGLRNHLDGIFRYETVTGLPDEAASQYMKLAYTREQLTNQSTYKSYEISRSSRIFLGEDHPYADGEEFSYQRPGMLDMKRRSVTDSLEADYIDTFFFDAAGEIVGWIEISGTRLKRIPDVTTIKWVEVISFILEAAVRLRKYETKGAP
jgi:hypothetical protein